MKYDWFIIAKLWFLYILFYFSANWVRLYGTLYQTPCVLLIEKREDELIFGELIDILCFENVILFHIEELEYVLYSDHFHAHVVSTEHRGIRYLIHPDYLLDYLPYGFYLPPSMSYDNIKFVVLKRNFN